MKRFPLLAALATILIIGGGIFLLGPKTSPTPSLPTSYEYFWNADCPHCAEVDKFMATWEGRDKIKLDKKEVWQDAQNVKLLSQRADSCGIPQDQVGVPFLFTPEGKCIVGDTPIIDFLKSLFR